MMVLMTKSLYISGIFCVSAASITYLTGTRLMIDGEPTYLCKYKPNLAEAKLSVSEQVT